MAVLIILMLFFINIFIIQGILDVQTSRYLIVIFIWMTAKCVSACLAFFNCLFDIYRSSLPVVMNGLCGLLINCAPQILMIVKDNIKKDNIIVLVKSNYMLSITHKC